MKVAPGQDRLDVVAPGLQQMSWALTRVAGSMWSPDQIDVHLGPLIERVAGAPDRLMWLQDAAAMEGARLVLAWLRSCYPEVSTHDVIIHLGPLKAFLMRSRRPLHWWRLIASLM